MLPAVDLEARVQASIFFPAHASRRRVHRKRTRLDRRAAAARSAIFEWIEVFYNRQRLHETLDYVSPVRYEEQRVVP